MVVRRQDAWTPDDDLILAEVTLRHIREGSTQLAAFVEVAEKLGRTPAACGFRWNSSVRKKYEAAIQIAKSQRQKRNQDKEHKVRSRMSGTTLSERDSELTMDSIIRFLRHHKNELAELRGRYKELERLVSEKEKQIAILTEENEEMKGRLNNVESDYQVVNDDYRTLIQIMDRARKMALLNEENEGKINTKFRMDPNGNLERIDK